jgi:hypothetical protein
MSDTKHLKTVLVSNFVVRVSRLNSNRCEENTKAPVVSSHANNNQCAQKECYCQSPTRALRIKKAVSMAHRQLRNCNRTCHCLCDPIDLPLQQEGDIKRNATVNQQLAH